MTAVEHEKNFYALREDVQEWISSADNVGPYADLAELKALRDRAPVAAQGSDTYIYLNRVIQNRELHEAL